MSSQAPAPRPAPRSAFVPFDRSAIEQSIPRRFEMQAAARPQRLAVKMGDVAWTYEALDRAANRVAHALLARSGPGARPVVLLIEQGPALVAGILGVLKAGGFYVPLESTQPPAHIATVLDETQAGLVLADAAGAAVAATAGALAVRVDEVLAGDAPAAAPGIESPPEAYAYIYYTSGSTGTPKGVVDTHRNVLHNVMRYTNSLCIDGDDRLTLLPSPSFSGAVSSLFAALLNGAAVFPYDVRRQGVAALGAWLGRERISVYHSVPALFRHALAGTPALPDLRLIRIEGDRMSRSDWALFRERGPAGALLVNGLGATECGLVRQLFIAPDMPVAEGVVPVGHAVEDMQAEVLDGEGRAVEPGQVGEIAVRSRYLAAGYWRRPDLDARAFSRDPAEPDLRTYRTGDLGRLRRDGCLEHLGRVDDRQKIQGQWVDLADVEAALLGAAGVGEAAARIHVTAAGDARLVAYVVPREAPGPTASALRRHLASRMPGAALPTSYVTLRRLPLTDNGKVDRSALPPPSPERPPLDTEFVAPHTRWEELIAAVWIEVLGLDRVGVHDSFFDLGGDSLRLGQVHVRLGERLGLAIGVGALFDHSTIHALAAYVAGRAAAPAVVPAEAEDRRPRP